MRARPLERGAPTIFISYTSERFDSAQTRGRTWHSSGSSPHGRTSTSHMAWKLRPEVRFRNSWVRLRLPESVPLVWIFPSIRRERQFESMNHRSWDILLSQVFLGGFHEAFLVAPDVSLDVLNGGSMWPSMRSQASKFQPSHLTTQAYSMLHVQSSLWSQRLAEKVLSKLALWKTSRPACLSLGRFDCGFH